MTDTTNKPAKTIKFGSIKATIWANETEFGLRHSINIVRLYKEGSDWKQSTSFNRDDLPVVQTIAQMAFTWIHAQAENARMAERRSPSTG